MPGTFQVAQDGAITAAQLSDRDRAATEWQAHLDAGFLTSAAPRTASPEIAANRARTERILRDHAAAVRAAERARDYWAR